MPLTLFVLFFFFTFGSSLTINQLNEMKTDITNTFGLFPSYGDSCNSKTKPCSNGDNMGALVRLAFHDATGGGGPNGCLDWTSGYHNGLEDVVNTVSKLYQSYSSIISLSDFWVLSANVAVEYGSTQIKLSNLDPSPGPLILPFRVGRIDAIVCDDTSMLPDADNTWEQTNKLFGGRMGMKVKEVVAIMGAHSLGRTQLANSGYDGGWTAYQSTFSNQYYKNFGISKWLNNNDSSVWVGGSTMLLQADVELLYKTNNSLSSSNYCDTFYNFTETTKCNHQTESSPFFLSYADSNQGNQYFYGNFSLAWQKMTEYLYENKLNNVEDQ